MYRNYADVARRAIGYAQAAHGLYQVGRRMYSGYGSRKRKLSTVTGGGKRLRLSRRMFRGPGVNMSGGRNFGGRRKGKKRPYRGITRRTKKYIKRMIQNHSSNGVNTYRDIHSDQFGCNANECVYVGYSLNGQGEVDTVLNTALCEELFGGNTQISAVDLTNDHSGKKVLIRNSKTTICMRNNAQMPCIAEVFWFKCRKNSNTNPIELLYDAGDSKQITAIQTDPRFNMFDGGTKVTDMWKLFRHRRYVMNGGDQAWITASWKKPFNFDYDQYVDQVQNWVKGRSIYMVIRVQGVPCHDETTHANVGLGPGTLDLVQWKHYKYESTIDKNYHLVNEGTGTLDEIAVGAAVAGPDVEEIKLAL